jgi:hypothetical protein
LTNIFDKNHSHAKIEISKKEKTNSYVPIIYYFCFYDVTVFQKKTKRKKIKKKI